MRNDATYAFLALFGAFFIIGAHWFEWVYVPAEVEIGEIRGIPSSEVKNIEGGSFSSMAYEQKEEWYMTQFPFAVEFPLYILFWLSAGVGGVAFLAGLQLFTLSRQVFYIACTLLFLAIIALIATISRGAVPLTGFWIAVVGASAIAYGSFKVSHAQRP